MRTIAVLAAAVALAGFGSVAVAETMAPALSSTELAQPLPLPFEAGVDAATAVDQAFTRARSNGKRVLIDFGANWCPDCRVLAGIMQLKEFVALINERFEVVDVDVGMFDQNMELVQKLGISELAGIPTVQVWSAEGKLLNATTAGAWSSAGSADPQAVYAYFLALSK